MNADQLAGSEPDRELELMANDVIWSDQLAGSEPERELDSLSNIDFCVNLDQLSGIEPD